MQLIDVAELLLAKGADVNTKDKYGSTPLHHAVSKGYKDLAKLLIASGADVNARASSGVTTPLGYAAY
jgi:ankyrin repeat protein